MKLYVYDHCPYCVKARMIFGFKNEPLDLIILLNDDEETPISMIGQKMTPILEVEEGKFMPESLDIIRYVDEKSGKPQINWKENKWVQTWLAGTRFYKNLLTMPRWVAAPLEEFKTQGAREYFTKKKENYIGSFKEALDKTPELIKECEKHLDELETFLSSEKQFLEDDWNVSHIHLFATLRDLNIVKGINFPKHVLEYMKSMTFRSGVPLPQPVSG